MITPKPSQGRSQVPLFITMPPAERERLNAFADRVGRPCSWLVRDALRVYLDAVEADGITLASLRAPDVDLAKAGQTTQRKRGRPPKTANVR